MSQIKVMSQLTAMSQITTHILDISRGAPARDVRVTLICLDDGKTAGSGRTDSDGRVTNLCPTDIVLPAGAYCLQFATGDYFTAMGDPVFYPWVDVVFNIKGDGQHYHIPLLLSPHGYSSYRGS